MKTQAIYIFESPRLSKRNSFLFIFFELLIISSIFLLHYNNTLILLAVFAFLVLNFSDPRITLWLLIAFSTLVIYYHSLLSAIMMVILGSILIFVCLSVYLKFCFMQFKIKKSYLNLPIAVFLTIAFFQTLIGIFNSYPLKWLGTEFLAYLGFGVVFLIISLCDRKMIKKFFQLLIVVAYYHAIIGLWNYFRIGHRIGGHLFGNFPSLIALVLLNLSFYTKEKSKKRIYVLISLPLVLHLLFSFTRGYWLGFISALLFSYGIYLINCNLTFSKKVLKSIKGIISFIIIILVFVLISQRFLPSGSFLGQVGRRFISSFSMKFSHETTSNVARLIEYKDSWEKIKKKPVLGYGVGYVFAFNDPISQKTIQRWVVHNFYLMITLKMGLIGLAVFLWIFYVFLRVGLRKSKSIECSYYKGLSFGFIANSIALLVISLTNHEFATVTNTFYLAFTLGGVVVITSGRSNLIKD